MGSSAPLQGEWPFSAVIVIFILMIKSLYATACGRTRGGGWLFLAGVNGHTLGQCGSAMTYCNDSADRKLQQSQLFPCTAACRPAKQSVDVKGSGVKKTQMR